MKVLVTVATYNERETVERLVREVLKQDPRLELLIIDDNSPDGTGDMAESLSRVEPRLHVVRRPGKLGLGSAILEGFRFATDRGYDFVLNMDADFSHDPSSIPAMLAASPRADVVIGSRYIRGGGVEGWSLRRRLASLAVNLYSRYVLGLSARDSSGGFRCYRVSVLKGLDFSRIISSGYSFQEELLFRLKGLGLRIVEVPIIFKGRLKGTSKVSFREMVRSFWVLLKLRWLAWLGRI